VNQNGISRRLRESGLAWLMGQVCTKSTFLKIGLFISYYAKQPNLSGMSLYALFIWIYASALYAGTFVICANTLVKSTEGGKIK